MRFYTTERLSAKRSKTPEGYLLCEGAGLARAGQMLYGPGETPIKPRPGDDRVIIYRRPDEVFAPRTIASYAGKPLVDDHPDDDVTPLTWRDLAIGVILNPRQGTGDQSDLLLGDILVTDPDAIELIETNDKVELSAGYDADYEQIGPGEGLQKNIIVNHVALVDSGRCGPRCRIGDTSSLTQKGRRTMASVKELLHRAFKAKDAAELANVEKEAEGLAGGGTEGNAGEHHVHVHLPAAGGAADDLDPSTGSANMGGGAEGGTEAGGAEARFAKIEAILAAICGKLGIDGTGDKSKDETPEEKAARLKKEGESANDDETIEGALEMEAPPGTGDKARRAKDSSYLQDAYQTLLAQVEIIAPGARTPTFDSAARPRVTYDTICGMRQETLARAYDSREDLRNFIDRVNNGRKPDFAKMTCDSARLLINAVAAEAGRLNNNGGGAGQEIAGFGLDAARRGNGGGGGVSGKIKTPAELNAFARKHYAGT